MRLGLRCLERVLPGGPVGIAQIVVDRLASLGINTEAHAASIDGIITGVNDKLEQLDAEIRKQQIAFRDAEDLTVADTIRSQIEELKNEAESLNVSSLIALRAIYEGANAEAKGILDIMDFDFIEALAIDGFNADLRPSSYQRTARFDSLVH